MTPELQNIITNAELTLVPLAVTALGLWLRQKIAELRAKDAEQQVTIDANTALGIDLHATVKHNANENTAAAKVEPAPLPSAIASPQEKM